MNAKLGVVLTLIMSLVGAPVFAQQDREIVIEPENPTSRDLVTIRVLGSECWEPIRYEEDLERHHIDIRLGYSVPHGEECADDRPYSNGYSRVIGPLRAGEYGVDVLLSTGGRTPAGSTRLNKSFTVTQAPPAEALSEGGITGFYYNPADDGHYVYILETDYTTLVVWNTFSHSGSPRWVYGVGRLQTGNAVLAEAYTNRSDGFTNGELRGLQVVPWGTLEVELESCSLGRVRYESHLPEFGSGEFPIRRLAASRQIGCEEID